MSHWSIPFLLLLALPNFIFGQSEESNMHELLLQELNNPYHGIHKADRDSLKQGPFFTKVTRNPNLEVFGWYPYWKEDIYQHLEYDLLSTIAYMAYEIKPENGKPKKKHDWSKTPMLDSANAHGVKLLLVATNYGDHNNSKFLKKVSARTHFIDNIVELLKAGRGKGVCLDFEGVTTDYQDSLNVLVKSLKSRFAKEGKPWEIYLTLPPIEVNEDYDLSKLAKSVDRFVITGYGYHNKDSENTGPIAPLAGGTYNVEKTVKSYLKQTKPNKLILGAPLFGMLWKTKSDKPGAEVKNYLGIRSFDYIQTKTGNIKAKTDTASKSVYKIIPMDRIGSVFRQLWFENGKSFSLKLDYITEKKLAGVALWALGYDGGQKEFWQVINQTIKQQDVVDSAEVILAKEDSLSQSIPETEIQKLDSALEAEAVEKLIAQLEPVEEILKPYVKVKSLVAIMLLLLLIFAGIGFLAALLFPDTRQFFFNATVRKSLLIWGSFFVLTLLLRLQNWVDDILLLALLCFMLGAFAMNIINYYLNKIKNDLP